MLNGLPESVRNAQPPEVVVEGAEIHVAAVALHARNDPGFAEKPRKIVDVPVRVVAGNPVAKPEHPGDPEEGAQPRLDLPARQTRVAVAVQQARLGREEQPLPVHVDRAALQDHSVCEAAQPQGARDAGRDAVVPVVGWVLPAPGVVRPICDGHLARAPVSHKDGPVVAAPRVVRRVVEEFDVRPVRPRAIDHADRLPLKRG